MGILSGFSSVLCMIFPVVTGTHFQWDMRWTSFLLSVLYGGFRGGVICAIMMLAYRAFLGGFAAWLVVAIDMVILFPVVLKCGRLIQKQNNGGRLLSSTFVAIGTYMFVEFSIFLYFASRHKSAFFFHQGVLFFVVYGIFTVLACVISVMLIESIFYQVDIRDELQKTEKIHLIGDLAASFAHEIRNPLTVAKGFIQLIAESLDTKNKHYINHVVTELDRAENIISDYLNLSKPQINKPEIIPIHDALFSLIKIMSPFAVIHKVEITHEVAPKLHIYADARQFKQMMINLIKNAIEAISNGGTVGLVATQKQNEVVIIVSDNGVGMTKEQLQRLGNPFYSTKSKGTGLGLMVTFRIIEKMGGKLHFESTQGIGTDAIVRIPIASECAETWI